MSLQETITEDMKQAMRDRNAAKLGTLRMLAAALKNAAIDRGGAGTPLPDEDVMALVRKEIKKREDAIQSYQKGGRDDLAGKESAEAEILGTYLPPPLGEAEIAEIVREAIREAAQDGGKPQMGAVMKAASALAAGRVDGKTLSGAVRQALA
ncbi:MAG: GatB/YqeY domain-containing protein [Verrucomicrobiota bacterium]